MPQKDKTQYREYQKNYHANYKIFKKEMQKQQVEEMKNDVIRKVSKKRIASQEIREELVEDFFGVLSDKDTFQNFVIPMIKDLKSRKIQEVDGNGDEDLFSMTNDQLMDESKRLKIRLNKLQIIQGNLEAVKLNRVGDILEKSELIARGKKTMEDGKRMLAEGQEMTRQLSSSSSSSSSSSAEETTSNRAGVMGMFRF